jgi:predicted phosphoribosyltransferase
MERRMKAAVQAVRTQAPARLIVAVPIGAPAACRELSSLADELVCAQMPPDFSAVGEWYGDFTPTTDDEVRVLLHAAEAVCGARRSAAAR